MSSYDSGSYRIRVIHQNFYELLTYIVKLCLHQDVNRPWVLAFTGPALCE